jgi:hypothetical protein
MMQILAWNGIQKVAEPPHAMPQTHAQELHTMTIQITTLPHRFHAPTYVQEVQDHALHAPLAQPPQKPVATTSTAFWQQATAQEDRRKSVT